MIQTRGWFTKSEIKSTCINIILPFSFETCRYLWPIWQKNHRLCDRRWTRRAPGSRCKHGMAKDSYPVLGRLFDFCLWGSLEGVRRVVFCPSLTHTNLCRGAQAIHTQCVNDVLYTAGERAAPRGQSHERTSTDAMVVELYPVSPVPQVPTQAAGKGPDGWPRTSCTVLS